MKYFNYAGKKGSIDNHGFVCWGGMGFQLSAIRNKALYAAAMSAI